MHDKLPKIFCFIKKNKIIESNSETLYLRINPNNPFELLFIESMIDYL